MTFSSIADITTAMDNGQFWSQHYYKPTAANSFADQIFDLSTNAGTPVLQPYIATPLTFTPQSADRNKYIYHGPTPPAGQSKYISSWEMRHTSTTAVATYTLSDLLGFYAGIDADTVDLQTMDNTLTLPRYTSGQGVQIVLQTSAPTIATTTATIAYVNHIGQAKTVTTFLQSRSFAGQVVSSGSSAAGSFNTALFVSLAAGDLGVRQINSIQLAAAISGYLNILLVKPLARMISSPNFVSTEKNFITEQGITMPKIDNTSALIIHAVPAIASSTAPIHGYFNFVWG